MDDPVVHYGRWHENVSPFMRDIDLAKVETRVAANLARDERAEAALQTVASLGYTYEGGVLWQPPVGKVVMGVDPAKPGADLTVLAVVDPFNSMRLSTGDHAFQITNSGKNRVYVVDSAVSAEKKMMPIPPVDDSDCCWRDDKPIKNGTYYIRNKNKNKPGVVKKRNFINGLWRTIFGGGAPMTPDVQALIQWWGPKVDAPDAEGWYPLTAQDRLAHANDELSTGSVSIEKDPCRGRFRITRH